MLNADSLTTLENLKTALKVTTTADDAYLEQLIHRATWWVEQRTNRKDPSGRYGLKARRYNGDTGSAPSNVHSTTKVRDEDYIFFDGTTEDKGGDTIRNPDTGLYEFHLPVYPVQTNSAGGVTFTLAVLTDRSNSGGETWDTDDYLENDQYVIDRPRGILRLLGGAFASGVKNYRITCAAGYQFGSNAPHVPPDLEGLCIEVCKKLYLEDEGVQSESLGSWSRTYDLDKAERLIEETISRYTRFVV